MINILLVGNGAREHVLAETIIRSYQQSQLFSFMSVKNPGITQLSKQIKLGSLTDVKAIVDFAKQNKVSFAIIGPEAPLEAGVVDALKEVGIPSIGPTKSLARLETSKSFTRDLLQKYNIPGNPKFKIFTQINGISEYLDELKDYVIKADGLESGKGVKLSGDHLKSNKEALEFAQECIKKHSKVVIEEKLEGQEFSIQFITDGKTVYSTVPAQDHKRAFENDEGPMTGGMGSYSCANHSLPFLVKSDLDESLEITKRVLEALHKECKEKYKGIMYGGFMATKHGVKLIEYNSRFGDPEALNTLPILKTPFISLCQSIISETLHEKTLVFGDVATVVKYVVPEGYPDNPLKGQKIEIGELDEDARLYYAAVDQKEDGIYTTGSRAIAVVGIAKTTHDANKIANDAIQKISGKVFFRKDIGTKELIDKRVNHMNTIRRY